jgi:DNA mismatch endonuclease (patch repair protein)
MDVLTEKQRSYCMSRISSKNTKPELTFRKLLSSTGIKGYRNHSPVLGHPDVYLAGRRIAVFIDGCFWHRCPKCFVRPKTRISFWTPKIRKNVERDRKVNRLLAENGIKVVRFWEHEIRNDPLKCYNKFRKIYEKRNPKKYKKPESFLLKTR